MKNVAYGLVAGVVLASAVVTVAQSQRTAPQRQPEHLSSQTSTSQNLDMTFRGRYQVVPTNDDYYKVFLVDSVTGDTWTVCFLDDQATKDSTGLFTQSIKSWCKVERTSGHGVIGKR